MEDKFYPHLGNCSGHLPIAKDKVAPPNGWEEKTWYLVEVSMRASNPVFLALFYTGFLNGGGKDHLPGGYNEVVPLNGTDDFRISYHEVYFMVPIKKLGNFEEYK